MVGMRTFKMEMGMSSMPPACIYFCIILWMRESGHELVLGHNYPEIYLLTANLYNLLELYF